MRAIFPFFSQGTPMESIGRIRSLFSRPQGEEEKIIRLFERCLANLDRRKKGCMIGSKQAVDYDALFRQAVFPARLGVEEEVADFLCRLYEGVNLWSDPQMQVNVVPPPTNISIVAGALAARFNENSIWDHYGLSAARSEVLAIGMLADLIGFDKERAGGIFTFGGTGCNLYATRIGIEKADPDAKHTGIRDRIHVYCSDLSHYSIKSAAIWTGIGLDNVRIIPSTDDNAMDIGALEAAMEESVAAGARIGTIFATMGTTDAFGLDPLGAIVRLRDAFQERLGYSIHVHADAVIGWPFLTFCGDRRLAHLPAPLRQELASILNRIGELREADSVGIDFHKTGWSPYLCSAFVVRDKQDLFLLEKLKREMPYLYHGDGYQPGTFTLESSRPNYAQKALANMLLLGREGYEVLSIHLLTMADYLRGKLHATPEIAVLNCHNPAFVTDFRIYPETRLADDGTPLASREIHDLVPADFTVRINDYNRRIAERLIARAEQEGSSMISYTESYKTTREGRTILGLKSFPMSPFMDTKHMDTLVTDIYVAKQAVDQEH